MITTFIDCPCGNTEGFELATNLAECTSCAQPVSLDTPTYYTRSITPLHVIEQRAKEQAVIDMWLDDQPFIDWSTCFDTNNIRVAV